MSLTDLPTFSVIMACHNAEAYISQAIDSVLAQTFTNWELIIVNDASRDDSLSYIESASRKDSRIKYMSTEVKLGPAMARNAAVEAARGDWLAILDADDIYLPNKLEKQYELTLADELNIVLIGAGCFQIDSRGTRKAEYNYPTSSSELKSNLLSMRKFPPHSSLIYNKAAFLKIGGFNRRFPRSQDFELWLRLSEVGDFSAYSKPLIEYRVHSSNITNSQCEMSLTQFDYAVAAAVCQIMKNAGHGDPRLWNDDLWQEYIQFVRNYTRQSGHHDLAAWKNRIKAKAENSERLLSKLLVFGNAAFNSPSNMIQLLKSRMLRTALPYKIYRSWMVAKGGQ